MGKIKAFSQDRLSIHVVCMFLIEGIMSSVRVWSDDFRDGHQYITGFQERSQTSRLQPFIAVLRLFFSGIPVRPVRQGN
jgi:hypothetical protein